ncbi:hypothetical protein KWH78_16620, partial [Morganella morganii]
MTTSVTATGSMNYDHFVEIAKKSNQDDIITLSSNGRESRLTAGRSLCDRLVIVLNSSCLGSMGFINAMYKKLEHREAQTIESFCQAIDEIYGEGSRDIVNLHLNGRKQLVTTDVNNILNEINKNSDGYRKCLEKDNNITLLLKENGFTDFDISQLNHSDFNLRYDLNDSVDKLMADTINRKSFCDNFESALKTAVVDFVTAMPASSHKFMDTVAGKDSSGFNATEQKYEINKININGTLDTNFTTEDFQQISKEAALLKAKLIRTGKQDQYRHQVYADNFRKVNRMPPQVHINATAPKNMALPPLPQVHT